MKPIHEVNLKALLSINEKVPVTFRRTSVLTGITRERNLEVIPKDYNDWDEQGVLIQRAMPYLSTSDREFLMTGATDQEWNEAFSEEE